MTENETKIKKLCDLYAKSQNGVDFLQKIFYEKGLRKGLELTGTTINESLDALFYAELNGYSDKYPATNDEFLRVKEAYIKGFNDRVLINGKASYYTRLSCYLRNYFIKRIN